jgi:hypothetical protein
MLGVEGIREGLVSAVRVEAAGSFRSCCAPFSLSAARPAYADRASPLLATLLAPPEPALLKLEAERPESLIALDDQAWLRPSAPHCWGRLERTRLLNSGTACQRWAVFLSSLLAQRVLSKVWPGPASLCDGQRPERKQ